MFSLVLMRYFYVFSSLHPKKVHRPWLGEPITICFICLFGAIANYYFTSVSFIIICYVGAVFRHKSTCIGFHRWVVGRNKPKAGENFNLCSWCCYGYLELTLFWFWEKIKKSMLSTSNVLILFVSGSLGFVRRNTIKLCMTFSIDWRHEA